MWQDHMCVESCAAGSTSIESGDRRRHTECDKKRRYTRRLTRRSDILGTILVEVHFRPADWNIVDRVRH